MALTCRNLLKLKSFEKIVLVAGENGLDKLVTWPYIKQTENLKGWVNGGEILFVVDESKGFDEKFFTNIIIQARDFDVSAVVFFCRGEEYIEHLPDEAIRLGNTFAIPLFEMPSEIRMIDVSKEITNAIFQCNSKNRRAENFLADLLHGDYFNTLQSYEESVLYGFDTEKSFFLAILSDKDIASSEKKIDSIALENRFSVIATKMQNYCFNRGEKFVHTVICGTDICYISAENNDQRKKYIAEISKILQNYNLINSCEFLAGVSRLYNKLPDMPRAYEEGRMALRYCMKVTSEKRICAFEEMGIMQFLISKRDKEAILEYCSELLKELYENDAAEQTEYVRTLWIYLKNNNNLVKTAQVLYIHRNTLVNRINKIQSIIGKDINSVEVKMEYLNAYSILEFYGMLG